MYSPTDTIVAPATALGGALMVIRLSGREAVAIADRIFHAKQPLTEAAGYTVHYGIVGPQEHPVDEVVATLFRAPRSYTGEDTVEFSCHGSSYITSEVLRLAIEAGARMAEPGEFTRRAYLNGKLDLSEAEAVADLIASESRAAHHLAMQQMRGGYSSALEGLREELLGLTALLELELDFGEEDVEFADRKQLKQTMLHIDEEITRLRRSFRLGNAIKEGIPVALVGAPNVGKSTLLNCLLGEERAMVSAIAGTTRDVIEECMTIDGVRFRLLDTAGLRHTEDTLEQMGIERTRQSLE
ncbi:MAG: tRNA uridine-5-carboxymethylaminomethyl(34) synthesis GTPase MnmE, partial [Alistipes sp.]|nr:tRNA uridine-5-carboxymethylaminomethyl(34) synthesis GTPase MnmE [Alistipes sp.]